MSAIDPTIQYVRCLHTDGHRWKLYEVHRTHLKKTKFFEPKPESRMATQRLSRNTTQPRFFDDYDHMLSVIGLIRFAMGIRENIVLKSDSYEVQELPRGLDPTRTIQQSLLSASSERPMLRDRRIADGVKFDRLQGREDRRERLTSKENETKHIEDK